MKDKMVYDKVVKYLGYLLKGQVLKTNKEIEEVKSIREYINAKMYQKS